MTETGNGGKPPRSFVDHLREHRMKECLKAIEENPDLCLWYEDLENLIPCVITKEQKKKYDEMFSHTESGEFPKFNLADKKPFNGIIYFGTGGAMEKGGNSFEDIFYKP